MEISEGRSESLPKDVVISGSDDGKVFSLNLFPNHELGSYLGVGFTRTNLYTSSTTVYFPYPRVRIST